MLVEKHPEPIIEVEVLKRHSMPMDLVGSGSPTHPDAAAGTRTGVTEVEVGYDVHSAMEEASAACIAG